MSNKINNDYDPQRFGLSYDPPEIVVEYQKKSNGKLYHHKIKFHEITPDSKTSEMIEEMYKKHEHYLNHKRINKQEIINLVEKLKDKYLKSLKEKEEKSSDSLSYDYEKDEDLNKVSEEELKKKKKQMNVQFERNNIKVGDKNYQYDVRKDFDNNGKAEWDDSF